MYHLGRVGGCVCKYRFTLKKATELRGKPLQWNSVSVNKSGVPTAPSLVQLVRKEVFLFLFLKKQIHCIVSVCGFLYGYPNVMPRGELLMRGPHLFFFRLNSLVLRRRSSWFMAFVVVLPFLNPWISYLHLILSLERDREINYFFFYLLFSFSLWNVRESRLLHAFLLTFCLFTVTFFSWFCFGSTNITAHLRQQCNNLINICLAIFYFSQILFSSPEITFLVYIVGQLSKENAWNGAPKVINNVFFT